MFLFIQNEQNCLKFLRRNMVEFFAVKQCHSIFPFRSIDSKQIKHYFDCVQSISDSNNRIITVGGQELSDGLYSFEQE